MFKENSWKSIDKYVSFCFGSVMFLVTSEYLFMYHSIECVHLFHLPVVLGDRQFFQRFFQRAHVQFFLQERALLFPLDTAVKNDAKNNDILSDLRNALIFNVRVFKLNE